MLLLSLLHRCGNCGTEMSSDLPKLPQRVSGSIGHGCRQPSTRVLTNSLHTLQPHSCQVCTRKLTDTSRLPKNSTQPASWSWSPSPSAVVFPTARWALLPLVSLQAAGALTQVPVIHKDHYPLEDSYSVLALSDNSNTTDLIANVTLS